MKKRILSIVLALFMVLALMPQMAFAAGAVNPYTLKGGTAGANGDEGPGSLIDGTTNTKWCVTSFSSAYIIFETSSAVNVSGYSITTGNDNKENPGRNPKNWTLYGCNDSSAGRNSTSWMPIHSVTNDTILKNENQSTYKFAFDKEKTAYQYYKLEITAIKSGNVMQMGEFALISCDHSWSTPITTAPTCTTAGYTKKVCTSCNAISISNYIAPLGHDFSGEEGKCTKCNKTKAEVYTFDISQGTVRIVDSDNINGKIKVFYGAGQSEDNVDPKEIITVTGSTTERELKIDTATPVTIKASDLHIDSSKRNDGSAMLISGSNGTADVTLILEGENTFKGGKYKAGISVAGGRKLTIEGSGSVTANGGNWGAGIGAALSENCGSVNISSGTVMAIGGTESAGIGSGSSDLSRSGGKIVITGGSVTAKGNGGAAGIGGGSDSNYRGGNGGDVIISGGTVTATGGNGIGGGIGGQANNQSWPGDIGLFTTQAQGGTCGNAVIFASSIADKSTQSSWSGVIFEGDDGLIYGTSVTPTDDFTIESGKTMTIGENQTLTISEGKTLTNKGAINNSGKVYVDGTFTGTADNLYYPLTIVNATASGDTSEYNSKNYGKAGSTITLSVTPQAGKIITWNSSPSVNISGNSFIMPKEALIVTAKWTECTHPGELTHTPAVPATYTEYGVKEYWTCSTCNMNFSDAAGTNEIADLDAWKTGEGKIDKLTAPAPGKSDSVAPDKDGNVTVNIEKSIVTVGGKTEVTVSDSIANKILAKLASSSSKKVIINATTGKNTVSKPVLTEPGTSIHVNLPESAVKKLAEVEGVEITLVTDNGKVVLDKDTIAAVASKAGNNGQVTLVIETVEQNNNLLKIELEIKTSNGDVTDFNKGNVKVTVAISEVLKGKKPVCVYIDEDGRYHKIGGMLNADGTFTFVIGHFSTYAIMAEEEADTVMDAQQKEETLAALADQQLAARSKLVTMKNGKKAVKITWYNKNGEMMDFDGVEIYRSTKKNPGSGKKPFYTTKGSNSKGYYINTKDVKVGTTYYYRVRGYVIIDGQKHYTDYSLKAIRTVK